MSRFSCTYFYPVRHRGTGFSTSGDIETPHRRPIRFESHLYSFQYLIKDFLFKNMFQTNWIVFLRSFSDVSQTHILAGTGAVDGVPSGGEISRAPLPKRQKLDPGLIAERMARVVAENSSSSETIETTSPPDPKRGITDRTKKILFNSCLCL